MKDPTAIITADWHLRDTQPICRTDNFWDAQWEKVAYIVKMQQKYKCPIIHAGDLFHTWKTSPQLLSKTIKYFREFSEVDGKPAFITVFGNHDLPQHNIDLCWKSGMETLDSANCITILQEGHWGQINLTDTKNNSNISNDPKYEGVLVQHVFTYTGQQPWPNCPHPTAEELLRKFPRYRLMITGDNHVPFVVKYKGRMLVNAGSLTRQTADQVDHAPRIYLWYSDTNVVVPIYIPIKIDVITRDHINVKDERNARMEAFILRLKEDWDVTLSFEDNLREFLSANKLRKSVINLIHQAMDTEN